MAENLNIVKHRYETEDLACDRAQSRHSRWGNECNLKCSECRNSIFVPCEKAGLMNGPDLAKSRHLIEIDQALTIIIRFRPLSNKLCTMVEI